MRRRLPLAAVAATMGLLTVTVAACATGPVTPATLLAAEKLTLAPSFGLVQPDTAAPDGKALKIWATATATGRVTTPATVQIDLRARGEVCQGLPLVRLSVDGRAVGTVGVAAGAYRTYSFTKVLTTGPHTVQVTLTNDFAAGGHCDRNVWLDWIQFDRVGSPLPALPSTPAVKPSASPTVKPTPKPTVKPTPKPSVSPSVSPSPSPAPTSAPFTTPPVSGSDTNPFDGAALFVDAQSDAATQSAQLRSTDPQNAALLQKIAAQPQADWYGDWNPASFVSAQVSARVTQVTSAGDLPVLVTYAIPGRDCNGYSAGGVSDATAYHQWMAQFASGIAGRKAVVILEPDALAQMDCLSADGQNTRLAELRDAVDVLTTSGQTSVYVDAGHSGWQSVDTMTTRLRAIGTSKIRGFSLNVSGFGTTTSELTYGEQLADATGTHYVIDTSRNGLGPGTGTCNPPGRALGDRPTALTSADSADAYLWVKHPGESDGDCGRGDPVAGTWSNTLAEDLASRATF